MEHENKIPGGEGPKRPLSLHPRADIGQKKHGANTSGVKGKWEEDITENPSLLGTLESNADPKKYKLQTLVWTGFLYLFQ